MKEQLKPMEGIFRAERAAAIEKVAREFGLPFQRIAGPGESYKHADGQTDILPDGLSFISIDLDPTRMDLFWDKVNEIEPPFRPSKTDLKPIPVEAWE